MSSAKSGSVYETGLKGDGMRREERGVETGNGPSGAFTVRSNLEPENYP